MSGAKTTQLGLFNFRAFLNIGVDYDEELKIEIANAICNKSTDFSNDA